MTFAEGDRVRVKATDVNRRYREAVGVGTVNRVTATRVLVEWDGLSSYRGTRKRSRRMHMAHNLELNPKEQA